jgi:hypothetical protein
VNTRRGMAPLRRTGVGEPERPSGSVGVARRAGKAHPANAASVNTTPDIANVSPFVRSPFVDRDGG